MNDSRYYDERYLNDKLSRFEGNAGNPAYKSKEQAENEQLRQENEMLKQRLQMAADPIRVEFEQSDEFRNAWLTNVVSYLYEVNMPQWAQSPYAQRLDEWTAARVEEIRQLRQQPLKPQAPPKGKAAQPTVNEEEK